MEPASPSSPAPLAGRQRLQAVATIMLGIALTVLDSTSTVLGLPTMTRDLNVSADQAIWIVNGFQLAALGALLPLAQWGERITYRRVYLSGVALWGLASALATLADSLPLLIGARVGQGLGAAGIMAVNMALVRLTWPPHQLGRGVSFNAALVSVATVVGPLLAAAVLSLGSWRWLFALNVPACVLLLLLGWRTLPVNRPQAHTQAPSALDIALNAGLFALVFLAADSFARSLKSSATAAAALLQGGVLLSAGLLVAWVHVRRQRRQSRPLLPLDLLRIPLFRLSMVTSVASFAAQTMTFVALPFLLLEVWRGTATQAGLLMSCWSVGTIVSALLVGRWTGRCHGGALGALGLGCLTLGLVWLAWIAVSPSESGVLAWSLGLCGIGFGLFQTPNNHHIITSAPVHRSGAASGMLGSARLTGQTLGASLVALVFAAQGQASRQGLGLMLGLAALLSALAVLASLCKLRHPQALNPDGPPT